MFELDQRLFAVTVEVLGIQFILAENIMLYIITIMS